MAKERSIDGRLALAVPFATAARRYWIELFPELCRERRRQRSRALAIPDPLLRQTALAALQKWGNVEGAVAFAAFVPRRRRAAAARAMASFQVAYNHLDMLSEQPSLDSDGVARLLHGALLAALEPSAGDVSGRGGDVSGRGGGASGRGGGVSGHEWSGELAGRCDGTRRERALIDAEDGGYLSGLVLDTRTALALLPAYADVAAHAQRAARRIVEFQGANTGLGSTGLGSKGQGSAGLDLTGLGSAGQGSAGLDLAGQGSAGQGSVEPDSASGRRDELAALERWGRAHTPTGSGLRWWETAAAAGSSLAVYALIALAAQGSDAAAQEPDAIQDSGAQAIDEAYFPWIGALHSLLDNLIDRGEDRAAAQHNLIGCYGSAQDAAARMGMLAERALAAARELDSWGDGGAGVTDAGVAAGAGGARELDGPSGARPHTLVLAAMASFYLATPESRAPDARPVTEAVLDAFAGATFLTMPVFRARLAMRSLLPLGGRRRARGAETVAPIDSRGTPASKASGPGCDERVLAGGAGPAYRVRVREREA